MKYLTDFIAALFVFILFPLAEACPDNSSSRVSGGEYVSKRVGIPIPDCEILYSENSHGGWLGDGETEIILQFTSETAQTLTENIEANEHWRELPMDRFVELIFYGGEYEDRLFAAPFDGEAPEIHEGYWFVYNKQTEEYSLDYETYREAYSHNYYISVYDSAEMKLYFYGSDS